MKGFDQRYAADTGCARGPYRSDAGVGDESLAEGYSAGLAKAAGKEYDVDGAGTGADASGAGADGTGTGADGTGTSADGAGAGADGRGAGADGTGAGADGAGTGADGTGTGADGADGGVVERYRSFMEWRLDVEKVDDVNSVGGIWSVVDEDVGDEDTNGVGIGLGERSSTDTARGFDKGDGIVVKYRGYAGDGGCSIDVECGGDVRCRNCVRYGTDAAYGRYGCGVSGLCAVCAGDADGDA